jgi:hypothetical protein
LGYYDGNGTGNPNLTITRNGIYDSVILGANDGSLFAPNFISMAGTNGQILVRSLNELTLFSTNSNIILNSNKVIVSSSLDVQEGITGSLFGTATTASYVQTAQTASYVQTAQTASYVQTAQTASYVQTAQTASYVLQAVSASYAATASYVENAQTASYVQNAQTASYVNPLTQDVKITGSLDQTGSLTLGYRSSNYSNIDISRLGNNYHDVILSSGVEGQSSSTLINLRQNPTADQSFITVTSPGYVDIYGEKYVNFRSNQAGGASVRVTGSVNISRLMTLGELNPLPAAVNGSIAFSSSGDFYLASGSAWHVLTL